MAEYAYQKHSTKIFEESSWVALTPHIWNGSSWTEHQVYVYSAKTNQYLFSNGNQYIEVTGSWYIYDVTDGDSNSLTIVNNAMYCTASHEGNYGSEIAIRTKNLIDLTNYNLLSVSVEDPCEYFAIAIIDSDGNTTASTGWKTTSGNITLDLSSITGSYYVQLYSDASDHGTDEDGHYAHTYFTITEVNLT